MYAKRTTEASRELQHTCTFSVGRLRARGGDVLARGTNAAGGALAVFHPLPVGTHWGVVAGNFGCIGGEKTIMRRHFLFAVRLCCWLT